MQSKTWSMRAVLAGLGPSAAALAVVLCPVVAGLSDATDGARSGSSLVGAWQYRNISTLTTRADRILRWVQCPTILNGR
jgi:hypothetical protein